MILEMDPPKSTGHKRVHPRRILNGIMFLARIGCQWTHPLWELGDDSTLHRAFQHWVELGFWNASGPCVCAVLVGEYEELGGVD